jgi:hypothetical protein
MADGSSRGAAGRGAGHGSCGVRASRCDRLGSVTFAGPGVTRAAVGFSGLALSPDALRVAMLAPVRIAIDRGEPHTDCDQTWPTATTQVANHNSR